jgi:hypothetical protein
MKKITLFFALITCFALGAQNQKAFFNLRSDTIDVLNYDLKLDFRQMSSQIIIGDAGIHFEARMNNVEGISMDLRGFTVDSVKQGIDHLPYNYDGVLLRVDFAAPLQTGDQELIHVFYRGTPPQDPSGFGGFYFFNDHAFNLGVGLTDQPHNYGRVWHPCFDNFVERATYDIEIISPANTRGYAVGELIGFSTNANNEVISTWRMNETIPTYLAAIAVGPFTHVSQTYTSQLTGQEIPVMLIAKPSDTTNMKNSFVNLFAAMDIYESTYGPYRWNKIGYVLTAFSGGAMEHSTMVTYPALIANGSLQWQNILVHELAHSWWGNNVTCRTASDMWINEGFATYSEPLFEEFFYSRGNYMSNIQAKHRRVIQQAHFDDGDFYPLSGIPFTATYSTHSYSKGATAIHNLRTYMGDDLFFNALKHIQSEYEFKDIDAAEMQIELETSSGLDLSDYFDAFIYNPGFSGFVVDSFQVSNTGNIEVTLFVNQKLFQAPDYYRNVPMEVTLMNAQFDEYTTTINLEGAYSIVSFEAPFIPTYVYLNKNDNLLNAVTAENLWINSVNTTINNYAYFRQTTTAVEDTVFLRIEHHRMAPDAFKTSEMGFMYSISPDRYWVIDGVWKDGFSVNGRFNFDGRNIASGNLDVGLTVAHSHNGEIINFHEDSLVLLWRANAASEWEVFPSFQVFTQGNATDGAGRIEVQELKQGQYTFGFKKSALSIQELSKQQLVIYPNPARDILTISGDEQWATIRVFDISGKELIQQSAAVIEVGKLPAGTYLIRAQNQQGELFQTTFIKQ